MSANRFRFNKHNGDEDFSKFKITRRLDLGFWKRCALIAVGLFIANYTSFDAISFGNLASYIALVVLIWIFNFVIRPFFVLFALPFIVLTFGTGMVFINALVIWIASGMIPEIQFSTYWWALWAAFLIEFVSWIVVYAESEKITRKEKKNPHIDV